MFITALWPPWSSSGFMLYASYTMSTVAAVMEKSHHHLGLYVCLFACIWRKIHVSNFGNQVL